MKNNKGKVMIIIAAIIAALLGVVIVIYDYINSDNYNIKKHLDLGNRYISNFDFENAISEYLIVVNIDNTNVEAYMKIAEAYHNLDDNEKEKKILEIGYDKTEASEIKDYLDKIIEAESIQETPDSEKSEEISEDNKEETSAKEEVETYEPSKRDIAIDAYYDFLTKSVIVWSEDYSFSADNIRLRFALVDIVSSDYPMLIVENTEASHLQGWYKLFAYIDGNVRNVMPDAVGDIIGYYANSGVYYVGYGMQGSYSEDYYSVNPVNGTTILIASRQGYDEFEEYQDERVFTKFFVNEDMQSGAQVIYNSSEEEFSRYIKKFVGDSNRVLFNGTEYAGNWLYESNGTLYNNNPRNMELLLEWKDER